MWLNGELVRTWVAGGDIPYQHVTLAVMFDSSHFEHGESVEVRITGHDNLGRFYDGGDSTDVRNFARCWRNLDFAHVDADGVAVAAPNLQLFNYQPIAYYDSWSADYFGDRMFDNAKLQMNMARRTPVTIGQAVYTELQARALNAATSFLSDIAPGKATALRANLRSTETISFAFYEVVGGVSTKGCGNLVEFGFDPVTKKIVQARVESRYTYDERTVVVSEAAAKARAIQLLRAHSTGASETIVSCKLQYIPISNGFGTESFEERRRLKRLGYGYAIRFARHLIFIDSRSGASLGGISIQ